MTRIVDSELCNSCKLKMQSVSHGEVQLRQSNTLILFTSSSCDKIFNSKHRCTELEMFVFGQEQVTLKDRCRGLPSQLLSSTYCQIKYFPSTRWPCQGSEAVQGSNKLGFAKHKIQKVIILAKAGLLIPLPIR